MRSPFCCPCFEDSCTKPVELVTSCPSVDCSVSVVGRCASMEYKGYIPRRLHTFYVIGHFVSTCKYILSFKLSTFSILKNVILKNCVLLYFWIVCPLLL